MKVATRYESRLRNGSILTRAVGLAFLCSLVLPSSGTGQPQVRESDRELVRTVASRLLSVVEPPSGVVWPPPFEIEDRDEVIASIRRDSGDTVTVTVSTGILGQMIEGDADRLALLLGHELAHILLGHPDVAQRRATPFVNAAYSRQQELLADRWGMEMALAAGFSYRRALDGFHRILELGLEYSSFEGLGVDHPSWTDRLAALDSEQARLWRAMSAFSNGSVFLTIEQYVPAEYCFRMVKNEFPGCHEGWANLGYALLMQYCDALEESDLRRLGIGQIVTGGFYRRPGTLESQVRGPDEELWWEAVGALREALRLNPELTLAKANLGIAYLVSPGGENVGRATQYLDEAARAAQTDASLDHLSRAAILINAGVVDVAAGRVAEGAQKFDVVARYPSSLTLTKALAYNRAMLLTRSQRGNDRKKAAEQLARYLSSASPASAWWNLAYEEYAQLCDVLERPAMAPENLRPSSSKVRRHVASVKLGDHTVALAEPIADVRRRLGPGESSSIVPGTNLTRIRYPDYGTELLVTERVIAVCLRGKHAPGLPIRESDLGSPPDTIRLGMPINELDRVLEYEEYDFRQLTDPAVDYRFYRHLGVAVRIDERSVKELVVAEIPERDLVGTR